MTRKEFMEPSAEEVKEGEILPIYLENFMTQEGFEGNALLIEHCPSPWREEVYYIRAEVGGTDKQNPNVINWSFQRWLVEFIDGPMKGVRCHRYIAFFVCIDQHLTSNYSHFDEET